MMTQKKGNKIVCQEKHQKALSTLYINNENYNLSKIRILQKNILYVIGLSYNLANSDILKQYKFLGQYGKILKIIVNKNGYNQNRQNETTYSAYITYSNIKEASLALLSIDNYFIDKNLIRASFGTTKYCNFFLKGIDCINRECLYMHEWTKENDMILREDMNNNKNIFYEQQKIAAKIAEIFNENEKMNILNKGKRDFDIIKNNNVFFPTVDTIYDKDIIYDIEKDIYFDLKSNLKQNSIFNCVNSSKSNLENNNVSDYNFEVDDDELEYILVKEPNKKRKKWRNQNFNLINQKKIKKPKYTLDEFQIRIKQRNEMVYSNSNSTLNKTQSSSSQTSINNISSNFSSFIVYPKVNIFKIANKSRFNFVNNNNSNEKYKINIPNYINEIIYKKFLSFSFFHKINLCNNFEYVINDDEIFSLEKEKIKNWNIDDISKSSI